MQNSLFDGSWELTSPNETLDEIKNEMLEKAKLIPSLANEVFVFSQGEPNAEIAVVGESPGPPDVESEKPFQGPSGILLDRILSSIGLSRQNAYLTNIVKFISQGDELTPEIIKFFTPFVWRELRSSNRKSFCFWEIRRQKPFSIQNSRSQKCAANFTKLTV